jgi:hypothetical protein
MPCLRRILPFLPSSQMQNGLQENGFPNVSDPNDEHLSHLTAPHLTPRVVPARARARPPQRQQIQLHHGMDRSTIDLAEHLFTIALLNFRRPFPRFSPNKRLEVSSCPVCLGSGSVKRCYTRTASIYNILWPIW